MKRRLSPSLYFLIAAAVSTVGVTLRSACMLTQFDAAIGYFNLGLLSIAESAFTALAVIAAVVGTFFFPKDALPVAPRTPYRPIAAYVLGIALSAFAVCLAADILTADAQTATDTAKISLTVLASPAAAYFLVTARRHGCYRDALVFLGFFPIFWSISAVAVIYSDVFVAMNSPIKTSIQMGLLGLMLVILAELRLRLGKPISRKAVALTGLGTYLSLRASLPLLLTVTVSPSAVYTACAAVLLATGLYGGYALFCYTRPIADEPCASDAPIDPIA